MTRATGRPVRYVDETDEEAYASRAGYGAPDWQVEAWVTTYHAIRDGSLAVVSPHVRSSPAATRRRSSSTSRGAAG